VCTILSPDPSYPAPESRLGLTLVGTAPRASLLLTRVCLSVGNFVDSMDSQCEAAAPGGTTQIFVKCYKGNITSRIGLVKTVVFAAITLLIIIEAH
jgi:hypothetical protein